MSVNKQPTLSIIIVSAFDSFRLNKTLDSLLIATDGLEVIIVCPEHDAATRDLSSSFARNAKYPVRTIFDENRGIYPAMNLGVVNAGGKYVMFWNSGDLGYSEQNVANFILSLRNLSSPWGVVQGEFDWRPPLELNPRNVRRFVFQSGGYISHQCVYAQKSKIAELGFFDTKYRVAADTKLISKLWFNAKPSFIETVVARVEFPSFSAVQQRTGRIENFKIALEVLPFPRNVIAIVSAISREFLYLFRKIIKFLRFSQ
jgi:glycosyltransferase involved in cell wall biosynthesis